MVWIQDLLAAASGVAKNITSCAPGAGRNAVWAPSLAAITTGGNFSLPAEKQRDIKLAVNYRPEWLDGFTFLGEYFRGNASAVRRKVTARGEHAVDRHRLVHRFAVPVRKGGVVIARKPELGVALFE